MFHSLKQVEALKALKLEENQELESIERLFAKNVRTNETETEINEIKKMGRKGWAKRRRNIRHISKTVIVFILVNLV